MHGEDRRKRLIQDMNRICNRVEDEHTWVSDFHLAMQEQKVLKRLQYDIEVPCGSQWCLLWYAAPTNLISEIGGAGISRDGMDKTIDHALRRAVQSPFT